MPGWYFPSSAVGGLGFYSARGDRAYGHVHVVPGTEAVARARELIGALRTDLPASIASLDIGFTGLSDTEERSLGESLRTSPGVTMLTRIAMERTIVPSDADPIAHAPEKLRLVPIRSVPREALAELDYRAFAGTVDASLIGRDRSEYRRTIDELIDGRLGPFLPEASTTIVDRTSDELLGAILTSEQSPQLAVFLDIMVAPDHRRAGLGRYLVRWGFRALWALGYPKVRLWVTEGNHPARSLYESVGFARVGTGLIYRFSRREVHRSEATHP